MAAVIGVVANWFAKPEWATNTGLLVVIFCGLILVGGFLTYSAPSNHASSDAIPSGPPPSDGDTPVPGIRYEGDIVLRLKSSAYLDTIPPQVIDASKDD